MKNAFVAALFLALIPMVCFAQQWDPDPKGEARRINDLAAADKIRTEQDARNYVDALARAFGDKYGWFTSGARHKLARAEYLAIRENRLVSDERLAKAVNDVNAATGAPSWARMNAAEVRNYRDANFVILTLSGMPIHLWHMPNIASRSNSGGLAEGSRPVEALFTLYALTIDATNLILVKDRVAQGQLVSLMVRESANKHANDKTIQPSKSQLKADATIDPRQAEFRRAQYEFLRTHNVSDINRQILRTAERLVFGDESK